MGSQQQQQPGEHVQQHEAYLARIAHRLESRNQMLLREPHDKSSSPPCIFKFIGDLGLMLSDDRRPHMVSIGPYHRGKQNLLDFEDNKWYLLNKLLSRTTSSSNNSSGKKDLGFFLREVSVIEARTQGCYAPYGDTDPLSGYDFVEMMLLDGCFVVEFLRFLGKSEDQAPDHHSDEGDYHMIFTRPSAISLVIADLLKLENQLPLFVLETLFESSRTFKSSSVKEPFIRLFARVIGLAFPFPMKFPFAPHDHREPPKHLLELVYQTLTSRVDGHLAEKLFGQCYSNHQFNQCVTELRLSGIKFRARESPDSFLDIKFENGVLEIPTITINSFTMNLLTNCLAWEQCRIKIGISYFTDYIYFMNCLIREPRDVGSLCADGIIIRHSREDADVVSYLNTLGKNIQVFDVHKRRSYLWKEMRDVEAYYSSNWATMMRTLSVHGPNSVPASFSVSNNYR